MDPASQFLQRLDARRAFIGAIALLAITLVMWRIAVWSRAPEVDAPRSTHRGVTGSAPAEQPWSDIPHIAGDQNPFTSPFLSEWRAARAPAPEPTPEPPPSSVQERNVEHDAQTVAPPPPPEPRVFTVKHMGWMARPDGTRLVLLAKSPSDRGLFFRTGDEIEHLRIGQITPEEVELLQGDTIIRLKTGERKEFTEP